MILVLDLRFMQGQDFQITVVDQLTSGDLDLATSVVRSPFVIVFQERQTHFFCSIGMVSFNMTQIMSMVPPSLPNVLLYPMRVSCTNLML